MLIRLSRFGKDLREPLDELELGRDLAALVGDLLLRSKIIREQWTDPSEGTPPTCRALRRSHRP